MESVIQLLNQISSFVWGPFLLIPLLLLTGLYLTVRLKGLQFRELGHSLWLALVVALGLRQLRPRTGHR